MCPISFTIFFISSINTISDLEVQCLSKKYKKIVLRVVIVARAIKI